MSKNIEMDPKYISSCLQTITVDKVIRHPIDPIDLY